MCRWTLVSLCGWVDIGKIVCVDIGGWTLMGVCVGMDICESVQGEVLGMDMDGLLDICLHCMLTVQLCIMILILYSRKI